MKRFLSILIITLVAVLFVVGCGVSTPAPATQSAAGPVGTLAPTHASTLAPTAAPPTATPVLLTPTVAPTAETAVADTPAPVQGIYDGDWEGKSSTDSYISFTVEDNEVTALNVNYFVEAGTCQSLSGALVKSGFSMPVQGKELKVELSFDNDQVSFEGAFTSEKEAAGTVQVKGKSENCGDHEVHATWSATKKESAESTPAPSESTAEASPSNVDPTTVLHAFFDALNGDDLDSAMEQVTDGVVYNIHGTAGAGTDELEAYLAEQLDNGVTYRISNIQESDGTLTFDLQLGDGEVTSGNRVVLDGDKIDIITLR